MPLGFVNPASWPSGIDGSSRNPTWTNLQTSFLLELITGSEVVIAHNVLDVSSALDVTLFSHMTIRYALNISCHSCVLHEVDYIFISGECLLRFRLCFPGATDLQLRANPRHPPRPWIATPLDREPRFRALILAHILKST